MADQKTLEKSYLALIEFLLLSKRCVISVGIRNGLTPMQSIALLLLHEPRPMNSFTKIFNCDASNITGIIDGLEGKKLVARYENPADRRLKMVGIEPKGKNLQAALIAELTGDKSYILAKLTDNEVKTFIGLVQKITQ